jgi:hypothetical protein
MALRSGIDTVAIVTYGVYTETYVSSTGGGNIASLFVSRGLIESAPGILAIVNLMMYYIRRRKNG